jgi:hypothetical protein
MRDKEGHLTPRINRRKWIFALSIAIALVVVVVVWRGRSHQVPPVNKAPSTKTATRTEPATTRLPASVPMSAVEAPKEIDHSGEVEVCGVGKVKIDRDDWTATGKIFDALIQKSRIRWLTALRNSDEYRARGTGLYLEAMFNRDAPQKDIETARDELVQFAVETKDSAVFALAFAECNKGLEGSASPGACSQLSIEQWTRVDPDNAVPWLQLAAKARRENDSAAEAAAFGHASQAHQYESYEWSLFGFAEPAMPSDVTAAARWYLAVQIIGVEAAMPMMPYQSLFQYCSRDALNDANVHRQCDAMADLLVTRATTLSQLSIGKALGARVGWPVQRVDHLTQQFNASMQVLRQAMPSDPDQEWSCDTVARGNAYMSEWVQLGELGVARAAIERSGETVAELARKHIDFMDQLGRDAKQEMQDQPAPPQP